jgi:hypothetical protein
MSVAIPPLLQYAWPFMQHMCYCCSTRHSLLHRRSYINHNISATPLFANITLTNFSVNACEKLIYEGRLQSSWTRLNTSSRNFVEVRWRSLFRSTSLGKRFTSYNAPPTSPKRAADRWSFRNFLPRSSIFMVGKVQKSHGAKSGLYGGCSNGVQPIQFFQAEQRIQFRSCHMRFLGFSNHEKGAPKQETSKWSTVCSTFSISGWSVVRSASLAKGGTSKKGPSPHLHKVPTRINNASPQTFKTALVYLWARIINFHQVKCMFPA